MNYFILRSNALGCLLLLITSTSLAVSLGPVRGAALVGRTLELSVLARLDPGDDPNALCSDVELAYSDTRIDSRKISVRSSATGEPGQALIRVTSSAIVDEPVVNIYLQVGCSERNSRRYVLLADLPLPSAERQLGSVFSAGVGGESTLPSGLAARDPLEAAGAVGALSGASSSVSDRSSASPLALRLRRQSGVVLPAAEGAYGLDSFTRPRPTAGGSLSQSLRLGEAAARKPGTPRLQLDSADLAAESMPILKSFSELQSLPSDSDPRRSEFAALWRALNLRPDEVVRDAQRLDELQAQARSLREVNSNNQAELGLTREQLKKSEVGRYANPLVYALLALLAGLLLSAGFFYYRIKSARQGAAWWDQRDAEPIEPEKSVIRSELQPKASHFSAMSRSVLVPERPFSAVPSEQNSLPGFRASDLAYSPPGVSTSPRGVNVNELFDIAQQADFFVSLGQHDHAIDVLANHIRENVQTSPLAYLDLFKLYHDMDRQGEYDQLRVEFNRIFNAEIPAFQGFRQRGEGLEAYEGAITRIQSLWNTPRVLDVIEESLFRKPDSPTEAFGLEAYRELLLLYAIANELVEAPRQSGLDPTEAPTSRQDGTSAVTARETEISELLTELQPFGASAGYGVAVNFPVATSAGLAEPRKGGVGLDIDLTDAWLGVDSPYGGNTVILPSRKPVASPLPSSAWLDFDVSNIGRATDDMGEAGDDGSIIKNREKLPRT